MQRDTFEIYVDALYVSLVEVESGNTPLHVAAINDHYDTIVRLIGILNIMRKERERRKKKGRTRRMKKSQNNICD